MPAILRTAGGGFIIAEQIQAARLAPSGGGWVIEVLAGGKWITTTIPTSKEHPEKELPRLAKWLMSGPPDGAIHPPPKKTEPKMGTA